AVSRSRSRLGGRVGRGVRTGAYRHGVELEGRLRLCGGVGLGGRARGPGQGAPLAPIARDERLRRMLVTPRCPTVRGRTPTTHGAPTGLSRDRASCRDREA